MYFNHKNVMNRNVPKLFPSATIGNLKIIKTFFLTPDALSNSYYLDLKNKKIKINFFYSELSCGCNI